MDSVLSWSSDMSFSARLIQLRKQKGLTQQGLADAANIHVQQVKRYEAGTSEPSAEALRKLAKTFSISADWLLFEEGERTPSNEFLFLFEAINEFPDEEKNVIKEMLEGMIIKYQARKWLKN
ncbi:Transcriptional regulator, XRE family [Xenorhabdus cabanillasii JM26]|uniref:Transcriptional regulator, XRE family n=2 Tax=Xenorhabdus cabanillasii TaxID=351673 RepID=W1J6Q6_9GAMM|nr:helix-turn-helix transcriptional regulator [Xenorhabdus cabanillasii]PHM75351.1 Repressor of flagellae, MrxJ [Xenorhabdus cabanillasii JM26]CDL86417.1 Transcriptional regulator, XRE family [Xenorhabdus cabanillasii JM26]